MMVRAPGVQRFEGGSDLAVSALDVPPTLLALAGIEVPESWPGRDLRPALREREAPGFAEARDEKASSGSSGSAPPVAERTERSPRWLRLLPLLLLAAMVAIALGIEAARSAHGDGGGVQWAVKLPLVILIVASFLRPSPSTSD